MDAAEVERIRALEEGLWRPVTRFDSDWMRRHVTDDVVEYGQSGRVHDRAAMLDASPAAIDAVLPLPDFVASEIAPGVALITYRSVWTIGDETLHTNRTSVWIRTGDGWRMRFHQGMPRSDDPIT
jgi:hypothetical protein